MYCENLGTGPDIVLIHGWGWHGGVWTEVAAELAHEFRVWVPDLPGHGRSREGVADFTLDSLARAVSENAPREATWIGWSLGALIALTAAQRGWARRLVLVDATPRFIQNDDWEFGLSQQWFDVFAEELMRDVRRALERFASLHLGRGGGERSLLRRLRTEIFRFELPAPRALHAGLELLEQSDLRSQLPQIRSPALVVHGARDQIALPEAGACLARTLPQGRFVPVAGAGHAPFLSHTRSVMDAVRVFLRE